MTDHSTKKPTAFVIMPFGEGFDEIYNFFVVEVLSEAGYEVTRADDIRSCQNILKDIVRGIADCRLVVADLTDSNPNVYYEVKYATPEGIVFDITTSGWKGAVKDVVPAEEAAKTG